MYEIFEHTADLGLRVRAATLEALFRDAAEGLFSMIVANLDDIQTVHSTIIEVSSDEHDLMLFDFLNEMLFLFETEHKLFREFQIQLNGESLTVECRGETVDRNRHQLTHEVKAITYHGLSVEQTTDGWLAELIVDI